MLNASYLYVKRKLSLGFLMCCRRNVLSKLCFCLLTFVWTKCAEVRGHMKDKAEVTCALLQKKGRKETEQQESGGGGG